MVLRRALRRLASTPAYTVGTIGGAAPGTGVTLAVFTLLNALALKTVPGNSGRLVAIKIQNALGQTGGTPPPVVRRLVRVATLTGADDRRPWRIGGPKSD